MAMTITTSNMAAFTEKKLNRNFRPVREPQTFSCLGLAICFLNSSKITRRLFV